MSKHYTGSEFEPMDRERFERIKSGCARVGITIYQSEEIDDYLNSKHAEGITYNSTTILLKRKPTASSVFEEIIHATQYRTGENDGSPEKYFKSEIAAQEKLIRNKTAYGISDSENEQTKIMLQKYKYYLEEYYKNNGK